MLGNVRFCGAFRAEQAQAPAVTFGQIDDTLIVIRILFAIIHGHAQVGNATLRVPDFPQCILVPGPTDFVPFRFVAYLLQYPSAGVQALELVVLNRVPNQLSDMLRDIELSFIALFIPPGGLLKFIAGLVALTRTCCNPLCKFCVLWIGHPANAHVTIEGFDL